jgi:DNA-binding winged helix-turn-helix (wHTH) protein/hemoglobin-like flavoprotein
MSPLLVRFGDLVLDERSRELRRAGAVVAVQPKVLEVLIFLLRHRDRAVTRDELHDAVWPDVVVGPSSLSRAIREVRKAIGDDGVGPEMVRTLSGHGFRFVFPAEDVVARDPQPAPPASRRVALHGRESEVAWLLAALSRASSGRVVVRLVVGEPGIGKTHLLDGLAAQAPPGARVLRGRVSQADAGAPLAAWREIAAELGLEIDAEQDDDGHDERRRRATALRDGVRAAAAGQVAVVLVDDADRADASSWRLVDDLLDEPRALPLLLVVSLRASSRRAPHVTRTVARALRDDADALRELEPLGLEALGRLVSELVGQPSSPAAVATVARLSGGHPLFARHLVHSALRAGRALETLDLSSLPRGGGLRELVLSYVSELDVRHRQALEAAAILRLPFSADLVADVGDGRRSEVADALDAAVDAGLLEPAERGRLRFVHEVVREVVGDALPPSRAAALHRRAALALDRRLGSSPEHLEMLALHYVSGATDGDAERALTVVRAAARHASRTSAFDVASRHLSAALDVEALLPADAERRSSLYLEHGKALARDGRVDEAARAFSAADPEHWQGEASVLRAAFHAISPDLPSVVERFYELLFARHPTVKPLFTRSAPAVQRRMFGETLVALVEHAGDHAWLEEHVVALGARHAEYCVEDEMYDWVRDAFLDAIDEASGRAGLPEAVKAAWARTYDEVAAKMIAAKAFADTGGISPFACST